MFDWKSKKNLIVNVFLDHINESSSFILEKLIELDSSFKKLNHSSATRQIRSIKSYKIKKYIIDEYCKKKDITLQKYLEAISVDNELFKTGAVKLDKNGEVISKKLYRIDEDSPLRYDESLFENMEIERITTNPNANQRPWLKFKAKDKLPWLFDEQDVQNLNEMASDIQVSPSFNANALNDEICVDIADIHAGLLHWIGIETTRKPDYDLNAIEYYFSQIVSYVNMMNAKKVHLFFPGDLAESFTGKNHKDTWKHLEKFPENIIIVIYKLIKSFIEKINNVAGIYFVDGNHDRLTARYETNSRKGMAEVISFFIKENTSYNVEYHPLIISKEIGGINHIMTHGDVKLWVKYKGTGNKGKSKQLDYGAFLFKYGKKDMFNILKTGHFHSAYEVINQGYDFLHYQCVSISSGNYYEESVACDAIVGFTTVQSKNQLPLLSFIPLKNYIKSDFPIKS